MGTNWFRTGKESSNKTTEAYMAEPVAPFGSGVERPQRAF